MRAVVDLSKSKSVTLVCSSDNGSSSGSSSGNSGSSDDSSSSQDSSEVDESSNSSSSSRQRKPHPLDPKIWFRKEVIAIKKMEISVDQKKDLIRQKIRERKKRELALKIDLLKKKKAASEKKSKVFLFNFSSNFEEQYLVFCNY